jgi:uncharacterized protein YyaL (SSP411 family)
VAEAALAGPLQIAIVGEAESRGEAGDGQVPLGRLARFATSPGAVVVSGQPDADGVPLLALRPLIAGGPAAYVCRGFVCDLPVGTAEALTETLARLS